MKTHKYGNAKVTRGDWSVGGMYEGNGETGYTMHISRHFDGARFADGKYRTLPAQLDGKRVTMEEYRAGVTDALELLYGYSQYYGRNTGEFVQSRAARKRGYKTANRSYNDSAREYKGYTRCYHNGNPALIGKYVVLSADGNYFAQYAGRGTNWVANVADATHFTYKGEAINYVNVMHYKGTIGRAARIVK